MDSLTEQALRLDQFHKQGYFILRGVFAPDVLTGARSALNRLVDCLAQELVVAGRVESTLEQEPFETRLYQLYQNCLDQAPDNWRPELHLPELYPIFFHSFLLDHVSALLGAEVRLYPNYTVRPKLPDHPQTLVLWHQDGGYTEHWHKSAEGDVSQLGMVNVWTPLVPARVANGCMQFLPGTHLAGLLPHVQREFYLEIPAAALEPYRELAVDIELDPGDIVVFHNMLCHRGLPNQTNSIRWSMDWRYQDARQPTLREEQGHLARSVQTPQHVVQGPDDWARRWFS